MDTGLSIRRLADAPHRLFFFLGTAGLLAASTWWLAAMLLRYAPQLIGLDMRGMSSHLHPLVMIFGFFPFFISAAFGDPEGRWRHSPRRQQFLH